MSDPSIDYQLKNWLAGKPLHNYARDECCPDFSCCKPELLAPLHEREAFCLLSDKERMPMLMVFLQRLVSLAFEESGKKVYVAGDHPEGAA